MASAWFIDAESRSTLLPTDGDEHRYGGLKPETLKRLAALAEDLEPRSRERGTRSDNRPIAGTRLMREWQGVEHCATVLAEGFEYDGRPYKSLSAIARAITGTRWNGMVYRARGAGRNERALTRQKAGGAKAALRRLYAKVLGGGARHGVQLPRRPARGL
ncbi:MAG: DUF2924 domain-containing protein [Mesorhizobium sp.]|nr:MAG: DUF2924 domain-containing protein [Mesorhizobium sp.]